MRWLDDPPIKLVAFDVDGVLTDGRIHYLSNGAAMLSFHVHDGAAIKRLLQNGIEVALITGRQSPMVAERARELGIRHVFQNVQDKVETLKRLTAELGLGAEECAYVGDDWPDLPALKWVGLPIAPADAQREARAAAEIVTGSAGGRGVAAEIGRLLLEARKP